MRSIWNPETHDIILSNWHTSTPDEIVKLVNQRLAYNAFRQQARSHRLTTFMAVVYQAEKLGLITRQRLKELDKELKALRARQHYVNRKVRDDVFARDGHKCVRCRATERLEIDHIKPVIYGGKSCANNLQTLCFNCHRKIKHREGALRSLDFRLK